jgi:hypothetical protein
LEQNLRKDEKLKNKLINHYSLNENEIDGTFQKTRLPYVQASSHLKENKGGSAGDGWFLY